MEPHVDVLTHQVQVRRPPLRQGIGIVRVTGNSEVIDERIEPDVDHLPGVIRYGDPPIGGRARDADVSQPLRDERLHFIPAELRLQELRVRLNMLQQPVPVTREGEEVVLLLHQLQRWVLRHVGAGSLAVGRLNSLLGGKKGLAANAIPTLVRAAVDIAALLKRTEKVLHRPTVTRLRGANEHVVGHTEPLPGIPEVRGHLVDEEGWLDAALRRRLQHLGGVLVRPSGEEHLLAAQSMVAREDVGRDGGVRRPDVGDVVHVVDGRGEVVGHGSCLPGRPVRCGRVRSRGVR